MRMIGGGNDSGVRPDARRRMYPALRYAVMGFVGSLRQAGRGKSR